jgi:hypothetical protein
LAIARGAAHHWARWRQAYRLTAAIAVPLVVSVHLLSIVNALNAELAGFFRAGPTLQLRVTATDSDGLLEAVVPHYAHASALSLPARRHGSGLIMIGAKDMAFPRLNLASWYIYILGVVTDTRPTPSTMPAYGWKLTDEQIAVALTFVRNQWGNVAKPVEASDVARIRASLQTSSRATR